MITNVRFTPLRSHHLWTDLNFFFCVKRIDANPWQLYHVIILQQTHTDYIIFYDILFNVVMLAYSDSLLIGSWKFKGQLKLVVVLNCGPQLGLNSKI